MIFAYFLKLFSIFIVLINSTMKSTENLFAPKIVAITPLGAIDEPSISGASYFISVMKINGLYRSCACGCGQPVTKPGNKYITHHNIKNHHGNNRIYKPLSQNQKDLISIALTDRVVSEETKKLISISLTGKSKSEEAKQNMSIARLLFFETEEGILYKQEQSKLMKGKRIGEDNPFYNKHHTEKTKSILREKSKKQIHTEHSRQIRREKMLALGENNPAKRPENKKKLGDPHRGPKHPMFGKHYTKEESIKFGNPKEKHPNWKGGISFEPYSPQWTEQLKKEIKERDNYQCQNPNCNKTPTFLTVHHIDYNKKNCIQENLITLCNSCNARANYYREFWKIFYQELIIKIINGNNFRNTLS